MTLAERKFHHKSATESDIFRLVIESWAAE